MKVIVADKISDRGIELLKQTGWNIVCTTKDNLNAEPADAEAPLIFLPALRPVAAQQQRLGTREMRARKPGIDGERAAGAVQRRVEFKPVVMDDRLIMQAQRIGRRQRRGAPCTVQRLVEAAQRAIHLADVAQIEWRVDAVHQRALHQCERCGDVTLAERDDACVDGNTHTLTTRLRPGHFGSFACVTMMLSCGDNDEISSTGGRVALTLITRASSPS